VTYLRHIYELMDMRDCQITQKYPIILRHLSGELYEIFVTYF